MFDMIGKFSSKYRYPIILFWIIVVVAVTLFAPSLSDVADSDQSSYLPADAPSAIAEDISAQYFPDQATGNDAVLILKNEDGAMLEGGALVYLQDLTDWLENDADDTLIGTILSPTDPALADHLVNESGQAAMIFITLKGSLEDSAIQDLLDTIQHRLDAAPDGITGYVTGSLPIAKDYMNSALESADRTTIITIILVITILLIIFRSPVAPFVPLLTIGIAYGVSRGVIAWLSTLGLGVTSLTEIFLVVILFGAGTDYCLFLISRFRELLADGQSGPEAGQSTISKVGETITSSAGTVIVGMIAMSFASVSMFADNGLGLAIGVTITVIAGLTLTPALLSVLGRWAFWPNRPKHAKTGSFWGKLSGWVTSRPWIPLVLSLVVLIPLGIYGQGQEQTFDMLADLPGDMPSKAGFVLLSEEFGAGEIQPVNIVITDIPDPYSPTGMSYVDALTNDLLTMEGVADVRSLTLPAGKNEPEIADAFRVDKQLILVADMIDDFRDQAGDLASISELDVAEASAGFETLRAYMDQLAERFPDLVNNADYLAAQDAIAGLEEAIKEGQEQLRVSYQLDQVTAGFGDADLQMAMAEVEDAKKLDETVHQMSLLRGYLIGLAEAYPVIADMDGYRYALDAMNQLEDGVGNINEMLLVSSQLDLLADSLSEMAETLAEPVDLTQTGPSTGGTEDFTVLAAYLGELENAFPNLASREEIQSAQKHLRVAQAAIGELQRGMLVSVQLDMVAIEISEMGHELQENPYALIPQPGEPQASEQMAGLITYLKELGAAHPSLAETEDYQTALTIAQEISVATESIDFSNIAGLITQMQETLPELGEAFAGLSAIAAKTMPDATFIPETLPSGMGDSSPALAGVANELTAAADSFAQLADFARQEMPDESFMPKTAMVDSEMSQKLVVTIGTEATRLAAALEDLKKEVAISLPDATYVPTGELVADEAREATQAVLADIETFQNALHSLSEGFADREDGFFVPTALAEEQDEVRLTQLLDTYRSSDGEAIFVQVVLDKDPYSHEAVNTVAQLRERVSQTSQGYVSGGTAFQLDLQNVMAEDTLQMMGLVLGGIAIVLILLLRSLVAPIYLLATILLSYGATLGITRLVFEGIFGRGLTWWVPFFMFVLLVALGMDYNIFLMGRVKEEVAGNGTRAGIRRALTYTGGIITSAGIIMAGTFGSMMFSSLFGLVQLSFAITVGILLDTFVIRTTLVPAIATLLGRWNWWPGRGPGG